MRSEIVQPVVGWVREGTSLQASDTMRAHLPNSGFAPTQCCHIREAGWAIITASGGPSHTHTRQVGPRAQGP